MFYAFARKCKNAATKLGLAFCNILFPYVQLGFLSVPYLLFFKTLAMKFTA